LHIKKGNPSTFEGWVDSVQKWSYPSVNMGTGLIQQLMLLGTFAGGSPIDQYQWVDQFVVSDQRIGCLSSSPSSIPDVPTIVASTSQITTSNTSAPTTNTPTSNTTPAAPTSTPSAAVSTTAVSAPSSTSTATTAQTSTSSSSASTPPSPSSTPPPTVVSSPSTT